MINRITTALASLAGMTLAAGASDDDGTLSRDEYQDFVVR